MQACSSPVTATRPAHARPARRVAGVAAILGLLFLGGCYEHVVDSKGIGASSVDVHKPNAPGARPRNSERMTTPLERK